MRTPARIFKSSLIFKLNADHGIFTIAVRSHFRAIRFSFVKPDIVFSQITELVIAPDFEINGHGIFAAFQLFHRDGILVPIIKIADQKDGLAIFHLTFFNFKLDLANGLAFEKFLGKGHRSLLMVFNI